MTGSLPPAENALICAFIIRTAGIRLRSEYVRARKRMMRGKNSCQSIWIRSAATKAGWWCLTGVKNSRGKAGCSGKQAKQKTEQFILSGVESGLKEFIRIEGFFQSRRGSHYESCQESSCTISLTQNSSPALSGKGGRDA